MVIEKPKGNLNNKGDIIILRNNIGGLIDQAAYGNWDDGNIDNNAPQASDPNSIARKFDGKNTYNNLNDFSITITPTKGASNVITTEQDEDQEEVSAEEMASYDYSNDIIVSEIFPNPEGSDTELEFIELFNSGDRDVDLTGWKLGDNSKKRYDIANLESRILTNKNEFNESETNITNALIISGGYLVVYRSESGIALNNTTDSVKLYQPLKDEPMQVVEYEEVVEDWSYINTRIATNTKQIATNEDWQCPSASSGHCPWQWTEVVTPGSENVVNTVNHEPEVVIELPEEFFVGMSILFDTSDTVDEDGDELSYSWDFGDGLTNSLASPGHTYLTAGNYVVKLVVSDGENEVEEERIINVVSESNNTVNNGPLTFNKGEGDISVVISEVLPNPEGTDMEGEWVEIKNVGEAKVNLLNWIVDDSEGGSKPYQFDSDIWIEAGEYFILDRVDSGLALNNSVDAVRLYNNYEELMDEIEYEKVVEGESYARGANNKLFWTTVLTPGSENVISVAESKSITDIVRTVESDTENNKSSSKEEVVIETSLEKIKELDSGELVKVAGVVAVEPGVLGTQYFYIVESPPYNNVEQVPIDVGGQDLFENMEQPDRTGQDPLDNEEQIPLDVGGQDPAENGEQIPSNVGEQAPQENAGQILKETAGQAGIQVYNYNKDFPVLKVGDYIEVIGELSVSSGEMRVKTKVAADMKVVEHREEPIAEALVCEKINEEIVGALITVTGEVLERKSSVVYLDDGSDEVIVYLKTSAGINPKSIEEGEILQVTGIVGRTSSGIRIMPRSSDDIIKKDVESGNVGIGQVLGEVAVSDEWEIAQRDKKLELFKYLLVVAGAVILVLVILLIRELRKK